MKTSNVSLDRSMEVRDYIQFSVKKNDSSFTIFGECFGWESNE